MVLQVAVKTSRLSPRLPRRLASVVRSRSTDARRRGRRGAPATASELSRREPRTSDGPSASLRVIPANLEPAVAGSIQ